MHQQKAAEECENADYCTFVLGFTAYLHCAQYRCICLTLSEFVYIYSGTFLKYAGATKYFLTDAWRCHMLAYSCSIGIRHSSRSSIPLTTLWSPSFWEFTQLDFKILLLLCCVMLLMSEESVSKFTGEVNTVISPSAIYNMTCCRTRSETCNSPNKCVWGTRWRYLYLLWMEDVCL